MQLRNVGKDPVELPGGRVVEAGGVVEVQDVAGAVMITEQPRAWVRIRPGAPAQPKTKPGRG